uniref:Uncharacterized protein n=1 Tax=Chenopodium quinoa TaxID=63459 RepID=A0A803MJC7_CHEQI
MADVNVTPEVVPVEDVEIDMEAKAKEYDTHTPNEFPLTTEVRNFSRNQVHMVETHFWQGFSTSNSFPALPVNHGVVMHQVAFLASGVKWGIIYADGDQARNRKFIVAVDGMTGKIYVESGPIGPVDWKNCGDDLVKDWEKLRLTDEGVVLGGDYVEIVRDDTKAKIDLTLVGKLWTVKPYNLEAMKRTLANEQSKGDAEKMVYQYGPCLRASPKKRLKIDIAEREIEKTWVEHFKLSATSKKVPTYNNSGVVKLGPVGAEAELLVVLDSGGKKLVLRTFGTAMCEDDEVVTSNISSGGEGDLKKGVSVGKSGESAGGSKEGKQGQGLDEFIRQEGVVGMDTRETSDLNACLDLIAGEKGRGLRKFNILRNANKGVGEENLVSGGKRGVREELYEDVEMGGEGVKSEAMNKKQKVVSTNQNVAGPTPWALGGQ